MFGVRRFSPKFRPVEPPVYFNLPNPYRLESDEECVYFKMPTDAEIAAEISADGELDDRTAGIRAARKAFNKFPRTPGTRICFKNEGGQDEVGYIHHVDRIDDYGGYINYIFTVNREGGHTIILQDDRMYIPPYGRIEKRDTLAAAPPAASAAPATSVPAEAASGAPAAAASAAKSRIVYGKRNNTHAKPATNKEIVQRFLNPAFYDEKKSEPHPNDKILGGFRRKRSFHTRSKKRKQTRRRRSR